MKRFRRELIAAVLCSGVLACAGERPEKPEPPELSGLAKVPTAEPVGDSLALRAPGGVAVWFTDSRVATDSTGAPCLERVMEIRRPGEERPIPVPLLYTGRPPVLINDSTIRARIWLNCRAGNTYDVNLKTGEPRRVE